MSKIELKFHQDLYPAAVVKQAAEDFSRIANFDMRREKDYHLVTIDNPRPDQGLLLKGNFLNYALMLLKAR
jgi:hypothetical protein